MENEGKVHPENQRRSVLFIKQVQDLYEQSFIMAENMIEAAIKRKDITGSVRDEYFQAVPMIADRVCQQIANIASMTRSASDREMDQLYESLQECIEVVRQRNKE